MSVEPPPEFYGNVIQNLRREWVDRAARRQGIEPSEVDRALIIGNTAQAEVRVNETVRAVVYVGDDEIIDLDQFVRRRGEGEEIEMQGILPDVPPDLPFMFFDERIGYLQFNLQPLRDVARNHLTTAEQFWFAAIELIERGGMNAACENMFGAAELATMALMETEASRARDHKRRTRWLVDNGSRLGLTSGQSNSLSRLHEARNLYRYGDMLSGVTQVDLVEMVPHVHALLGVAREAVESHPPDD